MRSSTPARVSWTTRSIAIETPVDDMVDPIVDPIVDDVFDTVDDIVGGGPIDIPDPIGGGDGGGTHVAGPLAPHGPPGARRPTLAEKRGAVEAGRSPDGPGIATGPTISSAHRASRHPTPRPGVRGSSSVRLLGGVARSLAIVLALFGLAVAFVTIQDRFDRSDPRLALAPVESDVVEFA